MQFFPAMRRARRALREASARGATVETSNGLVNEVLSRSLADVRMLTDTVHGPYPYAGIPWFSTAFGRDGIVTAIQMLWADPSLARGVLLYSPRHRRASSTRTQTPSQGKILHETRQGELARLGEVPFGRYYGSVDATPLFVALAGLVLGCAPRIARPSRKSGQR